MNGALKAAWGLTAFVVVVGVVMWIVTDRPIFAVFIVLGVLTGVGAVLTGRSAPTTGRHGGAPREDTAP
jgi:dolichol kinase